MAVFGEIVPSNGGFSIYGRGGWFRSQGEAEAAGGQVLMSKQPAPVPQAARAPSPAAPTPYVAADGSTFAEQPRAVQQLFVGTHGDNAAKAWVAEQNARLQREGYQPPQATPYSGTPAIQNNAYNLPPQLLPALPPARAAAAAATGSGTGVIPSGTGTTGTDTFTSGGTDAQTTGSDLSQMPAWLQSIQDNQSRREDTLLQLLEQQGQGQTSANALAERNMELVGGQQTVTNYLNAATLAADTAYKYAALQSNDTQFAEEQARLAATTVLENAARTRGLDLQQLALEMDNAIQTGQLDLGRARLDFDSLSDARKTDLARQLGMEDIAVRREQLGLQGELGRGQLGLDTRAQGLEEQRFAASLRGPGDAFTAMRVLRGQTPGGEALPFLNSLQTNTPLPAFQGPANATIPTAAQTFGMPPLGGQGQTIDTAQNPQTGTFEPLFQANPGSPTPAGPGVPAPAQTQGMPVPGQLINQQQLAQAASMLGVRPDVVEGQLERLGVIETNLVGQPIFKGLPATMTNAPGLSQLASLFGGQSGAPQNPTGETPEQFRERALRMKAAQEALSPEEQAAMRARSRPGPNTNIAGTAIDPMTGTPLPRSRAFQGPAAGMLPPTMNSATGQPQIPAFMNNFLSGRYQQTQQQTQQQPSGFNMGNIPTLNPLQIGPNTLSRLLPSERAATTNLIEEQGQYYPDDFFEMNRRAFQGFGTGRQQGQAPRFMYSGAFA